MYCFKKSEWKNAKVTDVSGQIEALGSEVELCDSITAVRNEQ